ncbi:gp223 [Bacillus phage W.Ph.]|uniref:Gp223 n=1 Tax=Bacillus phage W.Ph. TaxID=764595 RepID=G9B1X4_9CAUD|nr:gp223 [Bacillus phage W.Ph.]ADH03369.1 gp223 [Bacillus phage W.Ph.]
MSQYSTLDATMVFFLVWAQTFAYLIAIAVLCKGLYKTIQALCKRQSMINRAGWCVLLVVIPILIAATSMLCWEFLQMSADDLIKLYQTYKTS